MPAKTKACTVVWGASGGVGLATTKNLCKSGKTVIAYCRNPEELAALQENYPKLSVRTFRIEEDFYVQEKAHLAKQGLAIDGMVDCVGSIAIEPGATLTQRLDTIMTPNLYHQYFVALVFKELLAPGSSVVFISSIRALTGTDNSNVEYAFAKAALENMTKSLMHMYKDVPARVNCIRCTPIAETKISKAWPSKLTKELAAKSVYGELLDPQEVADTIDFLLADKSRVITGTIVDVSKGFVA